MAAASTLNCSCDVCRSTDSRTSPWCHSYQMRRLQSILSCEQRSESDQETSEESSALNRGCRPQKWFRMTHFVHSCAVSTHDCIKLQCKHCDTAVTSRVKHLTTIKTSYEQKPPRCASGMSSSLCALSIAGQKCATRQDAAG